MFKLLKDLTRPPEPLKPAASSSHASTPSPGVPYASRQRSRTTSTASGTGHAHGQGHQARSPSATETSLPPESQFRRGSGDGPQSTDVIEDSGENVVETDLDALHVVGLIKELENVTSTMTYVETFSQLLSVPGRFASRRAFRRHAGFSHLIQSLSSGLIWKPRPEETAEDEWQVEEVQRVEGLRLAFEVLAWAMGDREGEAYFNEKFGYKYLLPTLRKLSPPESDGAPNGTHSEHVPPPRRRQPDPQTLGLLLAHLLNNNYTLLNLFHSAESIEQLLSTADGLENKLGDVYLRWASGLPTLWAYLWGMDIPSPSDSSKGKEKSNLSLEFALIAGQLEPDESDIGTLKSNLIEITLRILVITARSSTANLFLIRKTLPDLPDFLLTRLYGWEPKRHFEVTFPATDEWYQNVEADDLAERPEWRTPSDQLRPIYLALLRRLLETGLSPRQTWRLFGLVRKPPVRQDQQYPGSPNHSGAATPLQRPTSPTATDESVSKPVKGKFSLKLVMPVTPQEDIETLHVEILDLIHHAMRTRWPDLFVFRGGRGLAEGGLEIPDLGRPWVPSTKGFVFSCWLYITKLNDAVTLVHLSQKDSKKPLLQVRVLENSQIGLVSSVHVPVTTTAANTNGEEAITTVEPELEEIICSAPDALIPHHQWVHFALGCRKSRSGNHGEARIFVDGKRVGAVRMEYPVPKPPTLTINSHSRVQPSEGIRVSVGRPWYQAGMEEEHETSVLGKAEDNEWMLGRTLMLEDAVPEDLVLLMHHLGPRYCGNFQEAMGKFLTYEGSTSINIYLNALAQSAAEKTVPLHPTNSALVRAIRSGAGIVEENVMFSLSAKDVVPHSLSEDHSDHVLNAAVPHVSRARDFRYGRAKLVGTVFDFSSTSLDVSVSTVGGGVVVLKMIDLAQNAEQLATALGILRDMIKDSWSASEEMERIHGFDLLAAILRPKMPTMVDVSCTKIILSMLGISMDKPAAATVHNSAAYRALGLEFELWSHAPLGVVSIYFEHFDVLLSTSKHKRFNLLRTFQKSNLVRKLLYALRSGMYEPTVLPLAIDTLRLVLLLRWSAEEAIKPIFSYLISALCQNSSFVSPHSQPSHSQMPAALILRMMASLLQNGQRLVKLSKALSLHRLLVIFLQSNPAQYVTLPCLDILQHCLTTPGMESFQRSFESEGGFALLARTLAPLWNDKVQEAIFKMIFGPLGPTASTTTLACAPAMASLMAALDSLLQAAGESEDAGVGGSITRPVPSTRARSGTVTSVRSVAMVPLTAVEAPENDERLEKLFKKLTAVYRQSSAFRRALTARRIETMLPSIADFAAMSTTSARPDMAVAQRRAASLWLSALIELSKAPSNLVTQMKLLLEQLRVNAAPQLSRTPSAPSFARSPTVPASPLTRGASYLGGTSFASRFGGGGASPSAFSPSSPISRRRPSNDAGPPLYRSRGAIERAPLKRVLTGESILQEGKDKNAAWRMIILQTDAQRHATMTLDRKEHWHRLSQVEWPRQVAALRAENGVWADEGGKVTWRLDGSEGPLRMRNRLERVHAMPEQGVARARQKLRDAIPSADELSSAVSRVNQAPWEDPFALALGEASPIAEEEVAGNPIPSKAAPSEPGEGSIDGDYIEVDVDDKTDKMRLIAKTLQAGDVVEEAHNIVRIVGVDALPGLLILGKRNLYLIDGLVQTPEGQVIEADQAPQDVLTIPSGTLADLDQSDQRSHRWPYNDVVESNKRAFLFRDVALELYFFDKQNFLVVFKDKKQRQAVVQKLSAKIDHRDAISRSVIGNFVIDTVARAIDKAEIQLENMSRRWQNREISNFAYLQLLNQHANRTPNDVTQYPVFPWVLADYTSQILDLTKSSTFRDLSMPMGALTPSRREAAVERYQATEGVGEKPFHYGTHYTSSMIVCGFMIRLSPFTEIFLALQGGNFDLADRLFSSIPRAWDSASNDNRGDVRELIPEFYYSPAFLLNVNHHDFGKKQVTGDSVDDVVLPPWALNDPLLFIHWHREALESDHVSRHLPQWIDLTFGYKQRDPASYNCFHPLSYRGAVDLDHMKDDNEKAASTAIIHNFGQTPAQIFKTPHPHRFLGGRTSLPVASRFGVAEHWQLLLQSKLPITETTTPIDHILNPHTPEGKPGVQQKCRLVVPGHSTLNVQYGFADQSIRVYHQETIQRLVHIVEGIAVTHAAFASPSLLVTVSPLGVITAWRLTIKGSGYRRGETTLQREATLRGHARPVTCVAVSTAWSVFVTGSEDGTAMVWDTNQLRYTRALQTPRDEPIKFAAVNEADGHIALASERYLYMFSLNGHPIAATSVDGGRFPSLRLGDNSSELSESSDVFTGGITFLTREFLKWGDLFVVGVGAELALYRCVPGVRRFQDQEVEPWRLVEQGRISQSDDLVTGDVMAVRFIGETLYAAFKPAPKSNKYLLYQWSLPDTNARHVPESASQSCMAPGCGRQFGLLEPRRHCGGCGGIFCGSHAVHVETFTARYCEPCRDQLAHGSALGILASRAVSRVGSRAVSRRPSITLGPESRRSIANAGVTGGTAVGPASPARSVSQPPSRGGSGQSSRSASQPPSRRDAA